MVAPLFFVGRTNWRARKEGKVTWASPGHAGVEKEAGGGLWSCHRDGHGMPRTQLCARARGRRQGSSPGGLGRLERWASPLARGKCFCFLFLISFFCFLL